MMISFCYFLLTLFLTAFCLLLTTYCLGTADLPALLIYLQHATGMESEHDVVSISPTADTVKPVPESL